MADFNPNSVDLDAADPTQVICYMTTGGNDYDGRLGARVSAIFVILILSTAVTLFPVVARRVKSFRIPLYVYLFARYFGAGVIIATAFIHLLDPAYGAIGPNTCVGMTGHWADYPWCPAIVLTSVMIVFLLDFGASRYVEKKYGIREGRNTQEAVTGQPDRTPSPVIKNDIELQELQAKAKISPDDWSEDADPVQLERSFKQQISAFLILEFGVIFHSVIIGLNLGTVGEEFGTLYPVLVFHQSFEGLGIGARMSAIPFPRGSFLPWILCLAYGLTTPIAIAIGLGFRETYSAGSFTASVVSGVLDAMSAGILLYTALVELLARDFLFNPMRTSDSKKLWFMIVCVLLGTMLMALLGKWA